MTPAEPPLPTFLIIGAQKSGTRWLRYNLGRHPDIFTAPRECGFFNDPGRFYLGGLGSYRAQFAGWSGQPIVGEATPGYMMTRHGPRVVAERIRETIPDARLIAILRNPVDRAYSAMVHQIARGRVPADADLLDLVRRAPPRWERFGLVNGGRYAAALEPYSELFGDQLLVVLHDDIRSDPGSVYEQALRHLAADPDFSPPDLDRVVFSNRRGMRSRDLTPRERSQLYVYFRHDVRELQRMLDRDLSIWEPDPLPAAAAAALFTDPFPERYDRALAWVGGLIPRVSPDQLGLSTPCTEWDVRALLDHLVRRMYASAAAFRRDESPATGPPDVLDGDFAAAYSAAAETMRAALRTPRSLRDKVTPPRGPKVPARLFARVALIEQLAHGWDLATATGQDATIPADLVEEADPCARFLSADAREVLKFEPEVPVGSSATPTERFVARLGRDPSRTGRRLRQRRRALNRRS